MFKVFDTPEADTCVSTCAFAYEYPDSPCELVSWYYVTRKCYLGRFTHDNGGSVAVPVVGSSTVHMEASKQKMWQP